MTSIQAVICIYLLKLEWEEVFPTMIKDTVKPVINTWKFYNDSKPSKYIMYLDANNLHGWAMSQCLPYNKFKWLNRKEIDKFDVVKNWWIWWRHIRSLYWTSSLITWIT